MIYFVEGTKYHKDVYHFLLWTSYQSVSMINGMLWIHLALWKYKKCYKSLCFAKSLFKFQIEQLSILINNIFPIYDLHPEYKLSIFVFQGYITFGHQYRITIYHLICERNLKALDWTHQSFSKKQTDNGKYII